MIVSYKPVVVATAALLILLAGCSQSTAGSPGAVGSTPPTTQSPSTVTSTSTSRSGEASGDDIGSLRPCDLVDDAGLSTLGLTGGTEKTLGQARVCEWRREGASIKDSFTLAVAIYENLGLADIVGTSIQTLPNIGSHQAVSFIAPAGSCGVGLGVAAKARVDSTVHGGDQVQACQLAKQLARLVESNLP
jgi:hypothetical protein